MIVPPGILLNLAFATVIGSAENWFSLTPDSPFKYLSVYAMILHNVQAWVLWVSAAIARCGHSVAPVTANGML